MKHQQPTSAPHSVIVSGIHLELTEAIRNFTERHTDKIFRHEPRTQRLRVDLESDKTHSVETRYIAKLHAEIPGNDILVSSAHGDLYAAIDSAFSKLDRQLVRRHEHQRSKRHKSSLRELDLAAA